MESVYDTHGRGWSDKPTSRKHRATLIQGPVPLRYEDEHRDPGWRKNGRLPCEGHAGLRHHDRREDHALLAHARVRRVFGPIPRRHRRRFQCGGHPEGLGPLSLCKTVPVACTPLRNRCRSFRKTPYLGCCRDPCRGSLPCRRRQRTGHPLDAQHRRPPPQGNHGDRPPCLGDEGGCGDCKATLLLGGKRRGRP